MRKAKLLLQKAQQEGYAIPAFNYADIWEIKAIVEAAQEENAPVIVASIPKVVEAHSLDVCAAMVSSVAAQAGVPVIHHLDHSTSVEVCKQAVSCGYDSVMFDGSKLSLEENIEKLREVVAFAHGKDVCAEGEIGQIMGRGYEGTYEGGEYLAATSDAVELATKSGVDSLAVGIGTAHGFYKGKPKLNFDRLQEIYNANPMPLVLHGGTGIPVDDVQKSISIGICKVNVGTAILQAHLEGIREMVGNEGFVHIVDINLAAKDKIKQVVREAIRMCMAQGKAGNER